MPCILLIIALYIHNACNSVPLDPLAGLAGFKIDGHCPCSLRSLSVHFERKGLGLGLCRRKASCPTLNAF